MRNRLPIFDCRFSIALLVGILAVFLTALLPVPLRAGTVTLTESNAASDLTAAQTCNSISALGTLAPQAMVSSGATTGTLSTTISNSSTQEIVFYSASGSPGATSWASGNYVISLNVTTASSSLTWKDACVVRVNSSGAAQATVGSLTGQNKSLGSTGVITLTVSGSAQTASSTDRLAVVLNINSSNSHGSAKSFSFDAGGASDTVATPISVSTAYTRSLSDSAMTTDSLARVIGYGRGPADSAPTSDSAAKSAGFPAPISDSATTADSMARAATFLRAAGDSAATSEALARATGFGRSPSDAAATSDALGRQIQWARLPGDSFSTSDSLAASRGGGSNAYTANLSDSAPTSDLLLRAAGFARAASDFSASSDALARGMAFGRLPLDSTTTADALDRAEGFARAAADASATSDAVAAATGISVPPLHGQTLAPRPAGSAPGGVGRGSVPSGTERGIVLSPRPQGETLGKRPGG